MTPPLVRRLLDRRVFQWAAAYLAGAWVLLQVVDVVGNHFAWPGIVFRVLIVLLGAGLPAVALVAWYHGERGAQGVRPMELALFVVLAIIAAVGVSFVGAGWRADAVAPSRTPAPAAAATPAASVAVLPFADMSPGRDQEYLSDGLAEEILNSLAQVPGLRVAARTSSFAFKGKDLPIKEVARQLEVRHVLEGSVRKAGDRIRLTAQLVDATTGYQLWSHAFDGDLSDVFAMEEQTARSITSALKLKLGAAVGAPLTQPGTRDAQAYSLYLQARFLAKQYTESSLRRSIAIYQQALARDPRDARAWAEIASDWSQLADDWVAPAAAYPFVRQAALKALALDSTLADAHIALGEVLFLYDRDFARAEQEYRTAIALAPNDPDAHVDLGDMLCALGRPAEGIPELERARALDPFAPDYWLARGYIGVRRYGDAAGEARRLLALDPQYLFAFRILGDVYLATGQPDSALSAYRQGLRYDTGFVRLRSGEVRALAALGRMDEARAAVVRLEVLATRRYIRAEEVAQARVALGDRDLALASLERAYRERSAGLLFLNEWPAYDALRSDPRFSALVQKLKL